MNTNEWQWAGFQLYLEMTDFWGQCRVLHQKPSVGILDLSSPLQYQGIGSTFLAIHPYLCKVLPFTFSILTAFRNTGSYVSQEIWMVNKLSTIYITPIQLALPRIQAQYRIWKASNSRNSLPMRSVCWNLNQSHCNAWYMGSEHWHLLQIWEIWKEIWQIQQNPINQESDQIGGGVIKSEEDSLVTIVTKCVNNFFSRWHKLKIYEPLNPILCPTWQLQCVFFYNIDLWS